MRAQSFQCAAGFSLLFHVFLLIVSLIAARFSNVYKTPTPYIVSLVDVSSASISGGPAAQPEIAREEAPAAEPSRAKESPAKEETSMKVPEKPRTKTNAKEDDNRVRDRIEAMAAQKRLEKMAALRKVVDIAASHSTGAAVKGVRPGTGSNSPSSGASYESIVAGKIHEQWIYPESLDRDMNTVIAVRIAKDGTVTILGVEKGSGNRLFDRSVISAITKASPLPPPRQEMEMGVSFRP